MGKTIATVAILSAVAISCAGAAVGVHALVNNATPNEDGQSSNSGQEATSKKILRIEKTKTYGAIDEFTITYFDYTTSTFLITNDADGMESITPLATSEGHVPTIEVGANGNWVIDGVDQGIRAEGIRTPETMVKTVTKIEKTNTYGTVDEYTITYSDESTSIFIFNSSDNDIREFPGEYGKTPTVTIGENGNWYVNWTDTGIYASGHTSGTGVAGKSAYQLAVDNGYTGTLDEWLLSLVGSNGKSAYELAVEKGYTGTESEWLDSLIGTDGVSAYQTYCENHLDPDLSESEWIASLYGEDGKSAYEIYITVNPGSTLSESEWLESLSGRGIASITGPVSEGLFDTYTINYSDSTTSTFVVRNGQDGQNGASLLFGSADPEATKGESGDSYVNTTTWEYFTKSGNAWTSQGTVKGVDGRSLYTGDGAPAIPGNSGDSYIDLSSGDYYVHNGSDWALQVNVRGDDGRGITTVSLTDGTAADSDEYTISYSDGTSSTFQIAKPRSIVSIVKTSTDGLVDTYTITYSYGAASTFTVTNGEDGKTIYHGAGAPDNAVGVQGDVYIDTTNFNMYFKGMSEWGDSINFKGTGITSITGPETVGLVDTYTINYSDSTTSTFTVTNGADGLDGTKVVTGSGAPSTTTGFQEGDAYIDNVTWNYYVLALNAGDELEWQLSGNIRGTNLTVGDVAPSSTAGFKEGDSYLNTSDWNYYVLTQGATDLEWTLEGNIHNSPNSYTVSFESNGGSEVTSITNATEGLTVTKPTNPTKVGYFFEGWYTEDGDKWSFKSDVVTDDITLYAKWAKLEVTNGVLTGCSLSGYVEIPYVYNDQIITSVANDVFAGRNDIVSIKLPNSITTLPPEVFKDCTSLEEVVLPEGLTDIPEEAFSGCTSLTVVDLPSELVEIAYQAFKGCTSLEAIAFPKKLHDIHDNAFEDCTSLKYFTCPDDGDLYRIHTYAFKNCAFEELRFPRHTQFLEEGCFDGCNNLKTLSVNRMLFGAVADKGIKGIFDGVNTPASLKTVIVKADSSTKIYDFAFEGASSVETVIFTGAPYEMDNKCLKPLTNIKKLVLPYLGETLTTNNNLGWLFDNTEDSSTDSTCNSSVPASLEEIEIKAGKIGIYGLTGCSNLKRLVLGSDFDRYGVTSGELTCYALVGCDSLEYYEAPYLGVTATSGAFGTWWMNSLFGVPITGSSDYTVVTSSLKEVVLTGHPDVPRIDDHAFYYLKQIKKITLPDNITKIDPNAFQGCGIEHIDIPDSVTEIEDYAFNNCESLVSVKLPNNPGFTGDLANHLFEGCISLESIDIPEGVTGVLAGTFSGCKNLKTVNLPSTFKHIAGSGFSGCSSLTHIELPDTFESIGTYGFRDCGLTSIYLPDTLTTLGPSSFQGCTKLTYVRLPNGITEILGGAFRDCDSLLTITIPDSVVTIGNNAFNDCDSLQHVNFGSGLNLIGDYAFYNCYSLNSLTGLDNYDSSVTKRTIGGYAFSNTALIRVQITKTLAFEIGHHAFYQCRNLSAVTINAKGVDIDIDYNAFCVCDGLTNVILNATEGGTLDVGSNAFSSNRGLSKLYISNDNSASSRITLGQWSFSNNTSLILVQNCCQGELNIGNYAFQDCFSLRYLKSFTNEVGHITTVGDHSFIDCVSLEEIDFTACTSIGERAFEDCWHLEEVSLPETIASIGLAAFDTCKSLRSIRIAANAPITEIPHAMCRGCASLEEFVFPNNITLVRAWAFYGTAITSIELPSGLISDSIQNVQAEIFMNCKNLKSVKLPDGAQFTTMPQGMFKGCTALEEIVIPANITTIGSNAFVDCTSLKEVILLNPDKNSLSIDGSAFNGCGSLDTIKTYMSAADYADWCSTMNPPTCLDPTVNTTGTFEYDYRES